MTGTDAVARPAFPVRPVLAAAAAAAAVRIVLGLSVNVVDGVQRGFPFYGGMARHLVDGEGLYWWFYFGLGAKWANRGPLYPLTLAGLYELDATPAVAVCVQSVLGGVACLAPAALAWRWSGSRGAVAAAWAAALWPYAALNDSAMVEHVLYAPLALVAVLAVLRARDRPTAGRALAAGMLCGVTVLVRLTFGLALPFLAATLLARRAWLRNGLLMAAGVAVVLLPWVVRNHGVVGSWTVGTDSGRALWNGNNPETFSHYPAGSIDESERKAWYGLPAAVRRPILDLTGDEVAQDRIFLGRAGANIAADPAGAAWGGVRKASALWSLVHNPGPAPWWKRLGHGGPFLLLLLASGAAVVRVPRMRADVTVPLAALAAFTLTAGVFWGQTRYLAPLHGLGLAAAGALVGARPMVGGDPAR
jgi:hypothetical protein